MRIAVAADQALIREAVRAALLSREQDVELLEWHPDVVVPRPRRAGRADAGVLVSDLGRWEVITQARAVMAREHVPWVALTGAERGPRWGAMIESGARAVLPSDTSLDVVLETLELARTGHDLVGPGGRLLRQSWAELLREHRELAAGITALTPAQRTVLDLLYAGLTVSTIAERLGTSTTTVRTQVKAIRDKLGVGTQLAAVAFYRHLLELEGTPPDNGAPIRS